MKKVLIVETNTQRYPGTTKATGLWLGECLEFLDELKNYQIDVDFVSPLGGFVPIDPKSMSYLDQSSMALYLNQEFIDKGLVKTKSPEAIIATDYQAIYFTGGHGVMWDFLDNLALQEIALTIYENNGYLLSVCHGIAGLLNIKDRAGNYVISGKKITGFTTSEEFLSGNLKRVPFLNQEIARKRQAIFKKKRSFKVFVEKDSRIITGQNPFSVRAVAKSFLEEVI